MDRRFEDQRCCADESAGGQCARDGRWIADEQHYYCAYHEDRKAKGRRVYVWEGNHGHAES